MSVEDRLPGLPAGVEDDTVPGTPNSLGLRDLMRLGCHLGQHPVVGAGERRQVGVVVLRDDQHVSGRLRVDIPESNGPGGLSDTHSRNIARHDLAEKAIRHGAILACYPSGGTADI